MAADLGGLERLRNDHDPHVPAEGVLFVRFLYSAGCRVCEMTGLKVTHVYEKGARSEIELVGKGNKVRRVRISSGLLRKVRKTFGGRERPRRSLKAAQGRKQSESTSDMRIRRRRFVSTSTRR